MKACYALGDVTGAGNTKTGTKQAQTLPSWSLELNLWWELKKMPQKKTCGVFVLAFKGRGLILRGNRAEFQEEEKRDRF